MNFWNNKERLFFVLIFALALALLLGIFIGRISAGNIYYLG